MPVPPGVTGYTSLTQQLRTVLEPVANPPGEQLLLTQTAGAATMSLTSNTSPITLSPTTGMHLHFFIIGNGGTGTIVVAGKDATAAQNNQTSQTYHVPIAPQNAQGYSEFTTKEVWSSVNTNGITLTSLTPCQVIIFGSYAAKYLVPITADKEEKIAKHSPTDKRGINFKNLRVVQLTKGADVPKFDSDLYPDSLWMPYSLIGPLPAITTVPAAPVSLLASTPKAATMTLTTSLATVPPGMFLIFTIVSNTASGTIVLNGTDNYGNAVSETITATSAASQTLYSTKRYSALTTPGANQFTTTGLTSSSIAVTAVFAWVYTWTYDGINNLIPYTQCLEVYDGVEGIMLPGFVMTDGTFDWQKQKEILFTGKGMAQDYCIVGDNSPTSFTGVSGVNPFGTLAQPVSVPIVSWPATFFIDPGTGTPLATQDGSLLTFKAQIITGRKWEYAGTGMQRPDFVVADVLHDIALDATLVFQNWQNYNAYFKSNTPLILGAQFQGNLLGSNGSTTFYEQMSWTLPAVVDTFKADQTKNPVEGVLKLMALYNFITLGYAYKYAVTAQVPPTYIS